MTDNSDSEIQSYIFDLIEDKDEEEILELISENENPDEIMKDWIGFEKDSE